MTRDWKTSPGRRPWVCWNYRRLATFAPPEDSNEIRPTERPIEREPGGRDRAPWRESHVITPVTHTPCVSTQGVNTLISFHAQMWNEWMYTLQMHGKQNQVVQETILLSPGAQLYVCATRADLMVFFCLQHTSDSFLSFWYLLFLSFHRWLSFFSKWRISFKLQRLILTTPMCLHVFSLSYKWRALMLEFHTDWITDFLYSNCTYE